MTRKRVTDIAPDRLQALNSGQEAASTLTECLAVDMAVLMETALPDVGAEAVEALRRHTSAGITRRMAIAAEQILAAQGPTAAAPLSGHPSDTVRGWACFVIGGADGLSLADRLDRLRPLADDPHFGVREWAWLALRPHIAASLEDALSLLATWTAEPSERLRRFASEATRPRGVWCAHLAPLKAQPDLGLPILVPLQADPAPYVQDSVGNWLNDAAKSQPAWVRALCAQWRERSPGPETARICKRALRSLDKTA